MSAQIVIAMYQPNEGERQDMLKYVKEHVPALREYELVTDRPTILMESEDGTLLEIFEWVSPDAARLAHEHPVIAKIWEGMGKVGSFKTLANLAEAGQTFPHFQPVDL